MRQKALLSMLLFLSACSVQCHSHSVNTDEAMVLFIGEVAAIRLEANRTTGFRWHYALSNGASIEIIADEYEEQGAEGILGAGGRRVLKIQGAEPGRAVIVLEYFRPWNPEDVAKRKVISVQVQSRDARNGTARPHQAQ